MKKIKYLFISLFFIISSFLIINRVKALSVEVNSITDSRNSLKECEYSEAYLKWLTLSETEKKSTIKPLKCKISKTQSLINNITSYSLKESSTLPASYSLVEEGFDTSIKDQMNTGSCWTFSTVATIETYMKKKYNEDFDLSERHIEYATSRTFLNNEINPFGYNREVDDGGNFFIASGYLMNNLGPVKESDMPFKNSTEKISLNEIKNKEVAIDINDIMMNFSDDCSAISSSMKEHLLNYGALNTNIYMTSSPSYYNTQTNALYYNGTLYANHAVAIVGWDDNYSKDNFSSTNKPTNDGAWLIKNSYGASWGNNGYFYVSYEDTRVCQGISGISDADTVFADNYYSHDSFGVNTNIGYPTSENPYEAYAANIFTKGAKTEELSEVVVGSLYYADLEIYVVPTKEESPSLENAIYAGAGVIKYGGYTTIKLENPILLKDEEFTIIVKYTSFYNYPIGASTNDNQFWANVTTSLKKSYTSSNGQIFTDLGNNIADNEYFIASIKAKTNNVTYEINNKTDLNALAINNLEGGDINLNLTTKYINNDESLDIKITKDGKDVTSLFTYTNPLVNNNTANLKITVPKDKIVETGEYNIVISYQNQTTILKFTILEYKNITIAKVTKDDYLYSGKINKIIIDLTTTGYTNDTPLSFKIKNTQNEDVTSYFTVTPSNIIDNNAQIIIKTTAETPADSYDIDLYIDDKNVNYSFKIEEYITANKITISEEEIKLYKGQELNLTAEISPSNVTNKNISWQSSNENVVEVINGKIIAKSIGECNVTAYWEEDKAIKDTVKVSVVEPSAELTIDKKDTNNTFDREHFYAGYGGTLKGQIITKNIDKSLIKIVDQNNNDVADYLSFSTTTTNNIVNFSLAIPFTATPNTYCMTYSAISLSDQNFVKNVGTYCFEIKQFIQVTQIIAADTAISIGKASKLNATVFPEEATIAKLKFQSNDENILTIDEDGMITPVSEGVATVTVETTDGSNISKNVTITVKKDLFINNNLVENNGYIYNLKPSTTYDDFISLFSDDLNIKVYNPENELKTSGIIGTGDKVIYEKNNLKTEYTIIILGDINNDGKITISDVSKLYNHYTKRITIKEEYYILASDLNNDHNITISDVSKIYNYYTGRIKEL